MGEQDLVLDVAHRGKTRKVVACFPGLKNTLVTLGKCTVTVHCSEKVNLNPAPFTSKL